MGIGGVREGKEKVDIADVIIYCGRIGGDGVVKLSDHAVLPFLASGGDGKKSFGFCLEIAHVELPLLPSSSFPLLSF